MFFLGFIKIFFKNYCSELERNLYNQGELQNLILKLNSNLGNIIYTLIFI